MAYVSVRPRRELATAVWDVGVNLVSLFMAVTACYVSCGGKAWMAKEKEPGPSPETVSQNRFLISISQLHGLRLRLGKESLFVVSVFAIVLFLWTFLIRVNPGGLAWNVAVAYLWKTHLGITFTEVLCMRFGIGFSYMRIYQVWLESVVGAGKVCNVQTGPPWRWRGLGTVSVLTLFPCLPAHHEWLDWAGSVGLSIPRGHMWEYWASEWQLWRVERPRELAESKDFTLGNEMKPGYQT